ncbi:hypothetical protein HQO42_14645 [Rhodococcus fascians]|nr:hypothetical protein [Rhodococcus fascians]MBY4237694.1 hypothetical protein [Rhodococcus fascians]MBY4253897.1 hypothetical protein [Rhodococcus fascians]MBY4269232.1 hypothetical protein [Rhodococcus fascians]
MNGEPIENRPDDEASRARAERARLARIFGDVLPETTGDERADGPDADSLSVDWLKQQRPPHYF